MNDKIEPSRTSVALEELKESSARSKDYCKFVIGLSTGTLVFSVTFIDKFGLLPPYKPIILIAWCCLIISIVTGVLLLREQDRYEANFSALSNALRWDDDIKLFSIEGDFNKLMTRGFLRSYLEKETAKDAKDEVKIKKIEEALKNPSAVG